MSGKQRFSALDEALSELYAASAADVRLVDQVARVKRAHLEFIEALAALEAAIDETMPAGLVH